MSRLYCIDTSAFIHAWNSYPPRIFPCLWRALEGYVEQERLLAPTMVYDEFVKAVHLGKDMDPSFHWLKSRKAKLFRKPAASVQSIQQAIVRRHPSWALIEGNDADPWVIALAEDRQAIVVSNESWPKQNEPKIPSVCQERGVEHHTFLKFIVKEDLRCTS